jgi:hypothetical protein
MNQRIVGVRYLLKKAVLDLVLAVLTSLIWMKSANYSKKLKIQDEAIWLARYLPNEMNQVDLYDLAKNIELDRGFKMNADHWHAGGSGFEKDILFWADPINGKVIVVSRDRSIHWVDSPEKFPM